nr:tetratricopeptide repeat protein [Phytohabitans houttuyneae]
MLAAVLVVTAVGLWIFVPQLERASQLMGIVGGFAGLLALVVELLQLRAESVPVRRGSAVLFDLVDYAVPVDAALDQIRLGVKPAVGSRLGAASALPTYVERDFDGDLRWLIAQGGFVCLHGPAASGKTRSAVEAVRSLRRGHRLFAPDGPAALRTFAEVRPSNAVVWLDDLERFLGPGGLDTPLFQRLCSPSHHDVVVIATIRDAELSRRAEVPRLRDHDAPEAADMGARLLAQIDRRRLIAVSSHLTEAERDRARSVADDAVRDALGGEYGFGESLAAGPALLERWSFGEGALFEVGRAVISAAVDCRRAGWVDPVPSSVLEALHSGYLHQSWRKRGDLPSLDAALEWASRPVMGASSCLLPLVGRTYQASDYLHDRTAVGDGPIGSAQVPDEVWRVLSEVADDDQLVRIGLAADQAQRPDIGERTWRIGADRGHPWAMMKLGMRLASIGRVDEGEQWLRRSVDAGCTPTLGPLGYLLMSRGETGEAELLLRQGAAAGDVGSMTTLALLQRRTGADSEAEHWLRQAANTGYPMAMVRLASLLSERDAVDEAAQWAKRASDAGDPEGLTMLAISQREPDRAEPLLRRAADTGQARASLGLAAIYADRGEFPRAERIARKVADTGDVMGMWMLHRLLLHRGETAEAERWLQRAAQYDPAAMTALGRRFGDQGDFHHAEVWMRRAADAQYGTAMVFLSAILISLGKIEEADQWLRRAESAGIPDATSLFATYRKAVSKPTDRQ